MKYIMFSNSSNILVANCIIEEFRRLAQKDEVLIGRWILWLPMALWKESKDCKSRARQPTPLPTPLQIEANIANNENAGRVASLVHANDHIGAYGFGPCKYCNKDIQARPILS